MSTISDERTNNGDRRHREICHGVGNSRTFKGEENLDFHSVNAYSRKFHHLCPFCYFIFQVRSQLSGRAADRN